MRAVKPYATQIENPFPMYDCYTVKGIFLFTLKNFTYTQILAHLVYQQKMLLHKP